MMADASARPAKAMQDVYRHCRELWHEDDGSVGSIYGSADATKMSSAYIVYRDSWVLYPLLQPPGLRIASCAPN